MEPIKKFKLATLGCRTNQYESAAYAKQLRELGFQEAKEEERAQVCIINTCTVTKQADRSSLYQIRKLSREHPDAKIFVTGCLTEQLTQPLGANISLVPNQKKEQLVHALVDPSTQSFPEFSIDNFAGHTRAFVKVQDGCNSFCTYCIIPYVRGRSRSRRIEEILDEIKTLIDNGYKEIVLTGINIGDFDGAPKEGEKALRLCDLVERADQIPGLKRLRLSSIDPDEVDENLQQAILQGRTTCPSLHLVLQSGSNLVLKRMNRKYTRQDFLETAARLKAASPEFTFTTDVIVGFPGETERDLEETLEVIEEVKFAYVHFFPYSARERTRAARYPNQISPPVMTERKQRLAEKAKRSAWEARNPFVGRRLRVLLEDRDPLVPGYFSGHSDHFLKVFVPEQGRESNEFVEVHCLENSADGLMGRVCDTDS